MLLLGADPSGTLNAGVDWARAMDGTVMDSMEDAARAIAILVLMTTP